MFRLHFERVASTDRIAEPTFVSLPLPQGAAKDAQLLRVLDGEEPLPRQARALASWPDGSVRWLLAAFQPDLPGNAAKDFVCDLEGGAPPAPKQAVRIEEVPGGWRVDTGPMEVRVRQDAFDVFHEVRLKGGYGRGARATRGADAANETEGSRVIVAPGGMGGGFSYVEADGSRHTTAEGRVESAEWVERGPLRAKLVLKGVHGGPNPLRFRVAMEFYAGKPWAKVQYQAVAFGPRGCAELNHWGLRVEPAGRAGRCEAAIGHYQCRHAPGEPGAPKSVQTDGQTALYTAFESIPETYCSNFWADWTDASLGGVGVSVFQAMQNFPKALRCSPEAVEIDLLPADQPPLVLPRGVGKTHSVQFHFHGPEEPLIEVNRRSFLFQMPDLPRLDADAYSRAGAFPEGFPARRFDAFDHWLHQTAQDVPRGFGMLHWGDHVEPGYTNQGRGQGQGVWCNGEYDTPHVYYALHALLGERWLRDYAAAAARHWMDVDLCHDSDDPLRQGGLVIHSANHVSGGVDISHEWTAGLLDHWHIAGDEEALEAAVAVGENVLRHLASPQYQEGAPLPSCRKMGWALRALGPLWQETGDERFRRECERIVGVFAERFQGLGGILDKYTEHNFGRIPFMIALTVESMRQWADISGDERVAPLIVAQADDLLEHAVGMGGFMYYKELPCLHRYRAMLQSMYPFVEAYRLTGEERFMRAAYRTVEVAMRDPLSKPPKAKTLVGDALVISGGTSKAASPLQAMHLFYAVMAGADDSKGEPLLKALDYRTEF